MAKKHLLWQLFPTYLFITLAVLIAAGWYASSSFRTFYLNQITEDLEARAYLAREIILPCPRCQHAGFLSAFDKRLKDVRSEIQTELKSSRMAGKALSQLSVINR